MEATTATKFAAFLVVGDTFEINLGQWVTATRIAVRLETTDVWFDGGFVSFSYDASVRVKS